MEIIMLRRDFFAILLLSCFLMLPKPGKVNALAKTDPSEVIALNKILGRWGKKADSYWNISGEPCSGWAIDDTVDLDSSSYFNPGIKCDCSYNSNKTCHIFSLRVFALNVVGPIPDELQNLTYLTYLKFDQNYLTGPIPPFIGNLTSLTYLSIGINKLSGPLPKEIGNLRNLVLLAFGTNKFSGQIPDEFGKLSNLQELYIDSSGLSGELPMALSNLKNMEILWASDNNFTGKIPDYVGTLTNMMDLRFEGNSFEGPIPESFSNLVNLTYLLIGDLTTGGSTLGFLSSLTSLSHLVLRNCKIFDTLPSDFGSFKDLQVMDLSFNNITGHLPQSLFTLDSLNFLFLGNNSIVGYLPANISINLTVDLSYNQLSGNFPPWYNQQSTKVNLVANNFYVSEQKSSILQLGLNCLQRDFSCYRDSPIYSDLAIKCGGSQSIAAGNLVYQEDSTNMSSASYYMSINGQWALSNSGLFAERFDSTTDSSDSTNFIRTNLYGTFHDELNSQLYQTARMSPSLRYYGLGLENRDYTVKLHFAEILYTDPDQHKWESLGRRLFDIYIQGVLREKDFNIVDEAGGRTLTPVVKNYTITVTNNFLEIHFLWAGKGTCCIPTQGSYGPLISAISVTPHVVGSKSKTKNIGLIMGIVACIVFGLLGVTGIFIWIHMKQKREVDEELLGMLDKPNVFSYSELRSATEAFSQNNILGEGGYGAVYKGKLLDGQLVAVKQLASKTHHGKRQFIAEVETISAVQHRNLVKLHGCCIEGSTPLLIYEYMENGSLDQAIFGKNSLYLDWETRYDICLGIARGLAYLHHESSVRIVHRDIKASNILLDSELKPKISDFGLAKFFDDGKTHISTRLAGTIGYLAPEYAMTGYLTEKTDVFAFGVVVLETVSGRPNSDSMVDQDKQFLLEWAWTLYEKDCMLNLVDKKLQSFDEEQVLKLTGIALLCIQASPSNRPSMSRVVSMMTGDSEIDKPASRPAYLTEWQLKELTNSNISEVSILREGR